MNGISMKSNIMSSHLNDVWFTEREACVCVHASVLLVNILMYEPSRPLVSYCTGPWQRSLCLRLNRRRMMSQLIAIRFV